jgi:hypothetical protein
MKNKIYEIIPQMKDYDKIGKSWLPFIMHFQKQVDTDSVKTDKNGFRYTVNQDGELVELMNANSIIIGGSTGFGVGCTSDKYTLASQLCKKENQWFNMCGRSFNSTQEWIIFLLFLPKKIDTVIIFSGVNNLTLSYLSKKSSPIYNAMFNQSDVEFAKTIALRKEKKMGFIKLYRLTRESLNCKLENESIEVKYEDIINCFERDIRIWKVIQRAYNFNLIFVMQPLAIWINKEFTEEEKQIFDMLDKLQRDSWEIVKSYLGDKKNKYLKDCKRICEKNDLPFFNINELDSFKKKEWLFVDKAHLTDLGVQRIREELKKEFSL